MERDGQLKSLAERMREKAEQERMETEKVFNEQLRTLSDSLRESSTNALRTMSDAMAQEITNAAETLNRRYRILSMAFGKQWLVMTALGIAFCLGIFLTGWLLTELGQWRLDSYRNELARVKTECQTERETLATLRTFGVTLRERKEGRFIVGPANSEGGWTIDTKPAIKLER